MATDSNSRGFSTREKGAQGEALAVSFLEKKGFKIVKQNFHFGKAGEIDIVAYDKQCLVFIEVKSRKSHEYGDPLFSINYRKQQNLRRAAEGYLYINKISDVECRFDVVTIDYTCVPPKIEHLISAL